MRARKLATTSSTGGDGASVLSFVTTSAIRAKRTWERTPEKLKWEVVTSDRPDWQILYELRVQCGLEIMRVQFFTAEEVRHLGSLLAAHGP
jgi:hypothetical protein